MADGPVGHLGAFGESQDLLYLGYGHVRVDHARDEFTKGPVHINGIEGFWGLAKVRLTKFKGLPRHTFHLHLKETEWRYWPARCFVPVGMRVYITGDTGDRDADGCGIARL